MEAFAENLASEGILLPSPRPLPGMLPDVEQLASKQMTTAAATASSAPPQKKRGKRRGAGDEHPSDATAAETDSLVVLPKPAARRRRAQHSIAAASHASAGAASGDGSTTPLERIHLDNFAAVAFLAIDDGSDSDATFRSCSSPTHSSASSDVSSSAASSPGVEQARAMEEMRELMIAATLTASNERLEDLRDVMLKYVLTIQPGDERELPPERAHTVTLC